MSLGTKQHVCCLHSFVKLWYVFTTIANKRRACSRFVGPLKSSLSLSPQGRYLTILLDIDMNSFPLSQLEQTPMSCLMSSERLTQS